MKWIFITLAGGLLVVMAYSTYSSINTQLQSSAVVRGGPSIIVPVSNNTSDTLEKTVTDTKNQVNK